jgi:hypothetical protein
MNKSGLGLFEIVLIAVIVVAIGISIFGNYGNTSFGPGEVESGGDNSCGEYVAVQEGGIPIVHTSQLRVGPDDFYYDVENAARLEACTDLPPWTLSQIEQACNRDIYTSACSSGVHQCENHGLPHMCVFKGETGYSVNEIFCAPIGDTVFCVCILNAKCKCECELDYADIWDF